MNYNKNSFNNLLKIRLHKNTKIPVDKGWNITDSMKTDISNDYNVGIPTGKINNIICIDVDKKDFGIEEFDKYIKEFGEPMTVKQSTPSGGFHYIFKYSSSNSNNIFLIDNYLTNRTKYRNSGIDIRTNGGFIVSAPSKIYDKEYKYIRSFDDTELLELPETLINWLLISNKEDKIKKLTKKTNKVIFKDSNIKYNIDDTLLIELIKNLSKNYLNDYTSWLKITTILKSLNKFEIWDNWSKKSKSYNYNKNINLWNANSGSIDINYLIYLINTENKTNYKFIEKYKIYNPLVNEINSNKIVMNNKYLFDKNYSESQFTYDIFKNYNTIIIKSCTGTGKTTSVANHISNYFLESKKIINKKKTKTNKRKAFGNYKKYKILSIITRRSLTNQHIKTFEDFGIKLVSYEDNNKRLYEDNIVCCINSILIYKNYPPEFFKDCIVYIDEIASFIEGITHNDTINNNLREIFQILIRIIKNAHKIIVSDALINDNVFELLKLRPNKVYIENTFKKYEGINAIKINNEILFLNKLKMNCSNNEYFFFGCDSCRIVTDFYNECIKDATDKSKYILITAKNSKVINNASEELKNKFVFYSPSITFGVDFSIDVSQDVFIYITGNSLLPSGSFQQTTRTRNIKNLYYYCNLEYKKEKFRDLEDVKDYYKDVNNASKNLNNMSLSVEEDVIKEDLFFNLFTYNEYVKDTYNTNKKAHYENILIENGFILSEEGINKVISKETKKEMKENTISVDKGLLIEYLESNKKKHNKYDFINKNVELLKLPPDKILEYSEYVLDSHKLLQYMNAIRILKSDDYISNKIKELGESSYNIKSYNSVYHKIKLLRKLESDNNIKPLEVEFFNDKKKFKDAVSVSEDFFKEISFIFRSSKRKPTNVRELGNLYRSMINNILSNNEIFIKTVKDGYYYYKLNIEYIRNMIILNSYSNKNLINIHSEFNYIIETIYNIKT